jgi:hypothetical protein
MLPPGAEKKNKINQFVNDRHERSTEINIAILWAMLPPGAEKIQNQPICQ